MDSSPLHSKAAEANSASFIFFLELAGTIVGRKGSDENQVCS
jgi:hypothetical protein